LSNPHTYDLGGPRRFDDDGNPERFGRGVEFVGTVQPYDFDQNIILERDVDAIGYDGNGQNLSVTKPASENVPPGNNDTGPSWARDDDPQSGDSDGRVYDWDNPGIITYDDPINDIHRLRANFKEFAVFNGILCSNIYKWKAAISMKKTSEGATGWSQVDDVEGDNNCGIGWLDHLTWNLQ